MKVRSLFSKRGHHEVIEPEVNRSTGSEPEMTIREYENIQTIVDSYKVQIENRWNLFKGWARDPWDRPGIPGLNIGFRNVQNIKISSFSKISTSQKE